VEDCRGGGGGVGVGGGEARVQVKDVGQWDMRGEGGYTPITGSINMQCVCLKNPGKDLYLVTMNLTASNCKCCYHPQCATDFFQL
jgi:hypothetical protein